MDEAKRRARAAWAYSGKQQDELAEAAAINAATLRGYLGRGDRNVPDLQALYAIADAAGVPRTFMDSGFADPADLHEQVSAIQRELAALTQTTLRNTRELQALRDTGRRPGSAGGGRQG